MNKKWKDRLGIGHIAKNYVKKKRTFQNALILTYRVNLYKISQM